MHLHNMKCQQPASKWGHTHRPQLARTDVVERGGVYAKWNPELHNGFGASSKRQLQRAIEISWMHACALPFRPSAQPACSD